MEVCYNSFITILFTHTQITPVSVTAVLQQEPFMLLYKQSTGQFNIDKAAGTILCSIACTETTKQTLSLEQCGSLLNRHWLTDEVCNSEIMHKTHTNYNCAHSNVCTGYQGLLGADSGGEFEGINQPNALH